MYINRYFTKCCYKFVCPVPYKQLMPIYGSSYLRLKRFEYQTVYKNKVFQEVYYYFPDIKYIYLIMIYDS